LSGGKCNKKKKQLFSSTYFSAAVHAVVTEVQLEGELDMSAILLQLSAMLAEPFHVQRKDNGRSLDEQLLSSITKYNTGEFTLRF